MDIIELYGYNYQILRVNFDLIYLLCIKIWGSLDLEVRSYKYYNTVGFKAMFMIES